MDVIEFFFCDFWHFVCLLLVCYALSPKIKIDNSSYNYSGDEEEEDS